VRKIGNRFCPQSSDCEEVLVPASGSAKENSSKLHMARSLEGGLVGVIIATPKLQV
jgi:hypothetical protein